MGLDQYAKVRRPGEKEEESAEIAYWRKHPNLQGWMHNLWASRGGVGEFNCKEVQLTEKDIQDLEDAVLDNNLPSTKGFFFGPESDEEYKQKDMKFIGEAKIALKSGLEVYYSSWW